MAKTPRGLAARMPRPRKAPTTGREAARGREASVGHGDAGTAGDDRVVASSGVDECPSGGRRIARPRARWTVRDAERSATAASGLQCVRPLSDKTAHDAVEHGAVSTGTKECRTGARTRSWSQQLPNRADCQGRPRGRGIRSGTVESSQGRGPVTGIAGGMDSRLCRTACWDQPERLLDQSSNAGTLRLILENLRKPNPSLATAGSSLARAALANINQTHDEPRKSELQAITEGAP